MRNLKAFSFLITGMMALCFVPHLPMANPASSQITDDLLLCATVYSRTSELFEEKGADPEKVAAYSAHASDFSSVAALIAEENGIGYSATISRQNTLVKSLNHAASRHPNGELGVIAEWIDYCDPMQPLVTSALRANGLR